MTVRGGGAGRSRRAPSDGVQCRRANRAASRGGVGQVEAKRSERRCAAPLVSGRVHARGRRWDDLSLRTFGRRATIDPCCVGSSERSLPCLPCCSPGAASSARSIRSTKATRTATLARTSARWTRGWARWGAIATPSAIGIPTTSRSSSASSIWSTTRALWGATVPARASRRRARSRPRPG